MSTQRRATGTSGAKMRGGATNGGWQVVPRKVGVSVARRPAWGYIELRVNATATQLSSSERATVTSSAAPYLVAEGLILAGKPVCLVCNVQTYRLTPGRKQLLDNGARPPISQLALIYLCNW